MQTTALTCSHRGERTSYKAQGSTTALWGKKLSTLLLAIQGANCKPTPRCGPERCLRLSTQTQRSTTTNPAQRAQALISEFINLTLNKSIAYQDLFTSTHVSEHLTANLNYPSVRDYFDMLTYNTHNRYENTTDELFFSQKTLLEEQKRFQASSDDAASVVLSIEEVLSLKAPKNQYFLNFRLTEPEQAPQKTCFQETRFTMDGPQAGQYAKDFVTLFTQTSEKMQRDILSLTQRYCGLYAIHLSLLNDDFLGYNLQDTGSSFISTDIHASWKKTWIMVHELAHERNIDSITVNELATFGSHAGQVHSREQSAYQIGALIPLIDHGDIQAFHTDAFDYNNDLMLIDDFLPLDQKNLDSQYFWIGEFSLEKFQTQMKNILIGCNKGQYESALSILLNTNVSETLTLVGINPQTLETLEPSTYHVRELYVQHLLMAYNAKLFFGQNLSPYKNLRQNIPLFLSQAINQDQTLLKTLEDAQKYLYLPTRFLPIAVYKGTFIEHLKKKETYIPLTVAFAAGIMTFGLLSYGIQRLRNNQP